MDIAELYASKYDFIHVYSYENAGISTTRNRALEKATGDYYLFVDSDDYVSENFVQRMTEEAIQNNADVVICNFYRFKTNNH